MKLINPFCLFVLLLIFSVSKSTAQDIDVYAEMYPLLNECSFIGDFGEIKEHGLEETITNLNTSGFSFEEKSEDKLRTFSQFPFDKQKMTLESYKDHQKGYWFQLLSGPQNTIEGVWQTAGNLQNWTGYETYRRRFIYMMKDSVNNSMVGALFIGQNGIVSTGVELPFPLIGRANDQSIEKKKVIKEKLDQLKIMINIFSDKVIPEDAKIYKMTDEPMSAPERVFGFSQFWTEVKYNFAFFDQVPNLNWDAVYLEYLPVIMEEQSNAEYFKTMEKICALLEDGHTNVFPPYTLPVDYPAVTLVNIGGRAVVENLDETLSDEMPRGSVVLEVDGKSTKDYLAEEVIPYISSSTDYIRKNRAVQELLKGIPNTNVQVKIKSPDGEIAELNLVRNRSEKQVKWHHEWPQFKGLTVFKDLGNETALVELNSFNNFEIISEFESLIDTLQNFDHFIIDLRQNGGGNSNNGYGILKYFAHKDFRTSKWSTREHQASFKAWGSQYVNAEDEDLSEWQRKAKQIHQGNYWFVSEPDTVHADKKIKFKGELIVLISNRTGSAAEDFLVALDDLGIGKLVGQPSNGSTGQPLQILLPRGGSARICTKKDTYPDGREFVGYGIKPDVLVEKTVEDFLSGRDAELEKALSLIKARQ